MNPWRRLALVRLHARMPQWLRVAVAVAAIVLGLVIVVRPTTALEVMAWLLGGGMVLTGVLELTGRADDAEHPRWRQWTGIAWLLAGGFVLFWPSLTVRAVATVVGVLLVGNGLLGIRAAFRRRRGWDRRIADGAFGVTGVIFGVLALFWPDITLLVVAVVFGARLVMAGVADLWTRIRRRRDTKRADAAAAARADDSASPVASPPAPQRRWGRAVIAIASICAAVAFAVVTTPLREASSVVDEFYVAPRDAPDEPGQLIRAEEFTAGIPARAQAWRILYTTTGVDGEVREASGVVVVPRNGDGRWPVIDWNHGTTGYAQHCAPSLQERGLWSGALYILPTVIEQGWAVVATDYIGLGTEGPHPYLMGPPSATASLDAVRAARQLADADLGASTVVWGHSQGGGAALWTGAMARSYAPEVWVKGVAAMAPTGDPLSLVRRVDQVTGGSIFASFAFASFEEIYDDVTYRDYIRPGADTVVRAMSERCLSDPGTVVSFLASLGMSQDPDVFSQPPTFGTLGVHLREHIAAGDVIAPLLIAQGGADSVIPVSSQTDYVDRLCAIGQQVDYRVYAGYEHAAVVERPSPLLEQLIEWTHARFDGEPPPAGCTRTDY